MAAASVLGSLIPTALRVAVSGGAAYGSVKYGAWTDSRESQEKLNRLMKSVETEIEYPQATKSRKVASNQ